MVSVGVDVSKEKSTVCFLTGYGEVLYKPFEISHTERDLSHLVDLISSSKEDVRAVMESTGSYHLPILNYLKKHGVFVSVINPLMMHKYANLTLRKEKTDALDSIKIAKYGLDNWNSLSNYVSGSEIYEELKLLNHQYNNYIVLRVRAKQSLTILLDRTMPGIKTMLWNYSKNPDRDKLCDFVRKYWHYDNITKMSEGAFVRSYNGWTKKKGYQSSERKAKQIYALASDGIPTLAASSPSTKMLLEEAVESLYHIDTTLAHILSRMKELASSLREYGVVLAMPGVGEILAPRIIAEIGNVTRFHSAKALVAYAGLDAPPFQSGNYIASKRSISKRGSASLRKTGYEIMKCLKTVKPKQDSAVYDFILKKESEGKPLKVAKIAGLNKFLHIYYARVTEVYQ